MRFFLWLYNDGRILNYINLFLIPSLIIITKALKKPQKTLKNLKKALI
jgi:hypothetical protein